MQNAVKAAHSLQDWVSARLLQVHQALRKTENSRHVRLARPRNDYIFRRLVDDLLQVDIR